MSIERLIPLMWQLATVPREEVQEALDSEPQGKIGDDRFEFVKEFAWSIPCKEAIDAIKSNVIEPIYDPMAGSGFMAQLLRMQGLEVVASDLHITSKWNYYQHNVRHGTVRRENGYRVTGRRMHRRPGSLLLSWPPYDTKVGYTLLKLAPVGTVVFYFGESHYGCTGSPAMHSYMDSECLHLETVEIPVFYGVNDRLVILVKKD